MSSATLLTRSKFFEQLPKYTSNDALPSDWICGGDHADSTHGKPDVDDYEHVVTLHGEHTYGEDCLLDWLKYKNTCPVCKTMLFEEEVESNDWINLRRILNLQLLQNQYSEIKDDETAEAVYNMWRGLVNVRATFFMYGQLDINIEEYGDFRGRANPQVGRLPKSLRQVDAKALIGLIDGFWDQLFQDALQSAAILSIDGEERLTIACHPISTNLQWYMHILERFDGQVMTARQLGQLLDDLPYKEFRESIYQLRDYGQEPHGFWILQALLRDATLLWFTELPVWQCPEGEESDFRCRVDSVLEAEEEYEGAVDIPKRVVETADFPFKVRKMSDDAVLDELLDWKPLRPWRSI